MTTQRHHTSSDGSFRRACRLEVGSVFGSVTESFLTEETHCPPWERSGVATHYVGSGRQALVLVERELSRSGLRTLLVPGYLCDSMIQPFTGWRIVPVRVTRDLRMDLEDLLDRASGLMGSAAALMAEYFGRAITPGYREVVRCLQNAGIPVVEDETHRVFEPSETGAMYTVASLRKCLPVADGGYVTGLKDEHCELSEPALAAEAEWKAMDALSEARSEVTMHTARAAVSHAMKELEEDPTPRTISERSLQLLGRLDYLKMTELRRANVRELIRVLEGHVKFLEGIGAENTIPSHSVVRIPRAREMQGRLARQGVFCPIHWPQPEMLGGIREWPDDVLSIPVDHRYTPEHMRHVASILEEITCH